MSLNKPTYTNRLVHESSPYLQQHAHNPVDWFPWGDEAFEKAKAEGKAVFLSVGYATCHWCHVMEHECFEDEEVAALLNRHFVSIKVDREERPDLDEIYMTSARYLGGGGGWPLSVVLTPERLPFFAATYMPKASRYGQEGMLSLMPRIYEVYLREPHVVEKVVSQVQHRMESEMVVAIEGAAAGIDLSATTNELLRHFDKEEGGQMARQKFPQSHQLLYLLASHKRTGRKDVLEAIELAVNKMRAGGIYDQIGYGIHRYAVDDHWHVPHFEKMLYNQAQFSMALVELYQQTGNEHYATWANEVFTYVMRDMRHPKGAFYSAEDADSEGEEGLFYVWHYDEVHELLGADEFEAFRNHLELKANGNWEEHPSGEKMSSNVLRVVTKPGQLFPHPEGDDICWIEMARKKLLEVRSERIRPLRDEKILTDWNALMVTSVAKGARIMGDEKLLNVARNAFTFIKSKLWHKGRLLHRWKDGKAGINAMLEDYTFLAWAAIEMYEATFDIKYLADAITLMETVVAEFSATQGGFYMTSVEGADSFSRPRVLYDNALPSGNGVAFLVLNKLAALTGDISVIKKADEMAAVFEPMLQQAPASFSIAGRAIEQRANHPVVAVLVLPEKEVDIQKWIVAIRQLPGEISLLLKTPDNANKLAKLAPFTSSMKAKKGQITAYVCDNFTCKEPIVEIEQL